MRERRGAERDASTRLEWTIPASDVSAGAAELVRLLHVALPVFTWGRREGGSWVAGPAPPPRRVPEDLSDSEHAAFLVRLAGLLSFLGAHGMGVSAGGAKELGARPGTRDVPWLASAPVPVWRALPAPVVLGAVALRLAGRGAPSGRAGEARRSLEEALGDGLPARSAEVISAILRAADGTRPSDALLLDLARTGDVGERVALDLLGLAVPRELAPYSGQRLVAAGGAADWVARGASRREPGETAFAEAGPPVSVEEGSSLLELAVALGPDPRAEVLRGLARGESPVPASGPPLVLLARDFDLWDARSARAWEELPRLAGPLVRIETRVEAPAPWQALALLVPRLGREEISGLVHLPYSSPAASARLWEGLASEAGGDALRLLRAARQRARAFLGGPSRPAPSKRPLASVDVVLRAAALLGDGFPLAEAAAAAGTTLGRATEVLEEATDAGTILRASRDGYRFADEERRRRLVGALSAAERASGLARLERAGIEPFRLLLVRLSAGPRESDVDEARQRLSEAVRSGRSGEAAALLSRAPASAPDLAEPLLAVEAWVLAGRMEEARAAAARVDTDAALAEERAGARGPPACWPASARPGRRSPCFPSTRTWRGASRGPTSSCASAGRRTPRGSSRRSVRAAGRAARAATSFAPSSTSGGRSSRPRRRSSGPWPRRSSTGTTARCLSTRASPRDTSRWGSAGPARPAPSSGSRATRRGNPRGRPMLSTTCPSPRRRTGRSRRRRRLSRKRSASTRPSGKGIDTSPRSGSGPRSRSGGATPGRPIATSRRSSRTTGSRAGPSSSSSRSRSGSGSPSPRATTRTEPRPGRRPSRASGNARITRPGARSSSSKGRASSRRDSPPRPSRGSRRQSPTPTRGAASRRSARRLAASARSDLGLGAVPPPGVDGAQRTLLEAEERLAKGLPPQPGARRVLADRLERPDGPLEVTMRLLEWRGRFPALFATPELAPLRELGLRAARRAGLDGAATRFPAVAGSPGRAETVGVAPPDPSVVAEDAASREVFQTVRRVAPHRISVLVLGESGTGKEVVARELHRASGRKGHFVAVNVAALPETLAEAELFGAARGAFTGADRDRTGVIEASSGGTLFLDEIGDLSPQVQAKLLRVLQEREVRRLGETRTRAVDLRLVAATHHDLARLAGEGRFRADLLYRIAGITVSLPPLRERPRDLRVLLDRALAGTPLAPDARAALLSWSWPGNARELLSAVEAAKALAGPGSRVETGHLPARLRAAKEEPAAGKGRYREAVDEAKKRVILETLAEAGGNRTRAAALLGLSRQSLLYEMKRLGITD